MGHSCGDLPDGIYLCPTCRDHLIQDLEQVPSTIQDLWTTAARMDVGAPSVGGGGPAGSTEPANLDAMDKGRTLAAVLNGWADALGHPEKDPVRSASALLARIREVRCMDWAPVLKQELRDALNDCRRSMDRAEARVFAGMCPTNLDGVECGRAVYTRPGRTLATCNKCGFEWDVTDWRYRALEAAGTQHGTPAQLSRMLSDPVTGDALPQATIRQWVRRGKLTPISRNSMGKACYQVRKVRNLWDRSRAAVMARQAA